MTLACSIKAVNATLQAHAFQGRQKGSAGQQPSAGTAACAQLPAGAARQIVTLFYMQQGAPSGPIRSRRQRPRSGGKPKRHQASACPTHLHSDMSRRSKAAAVTPRAGNTRLATCAVSAQATDCSGSIAPAPVEYQRSRSDCKSGPQQPWQHSGHSSVTITMLQRGMHPDNQMAAASLLHRSQIVGQKAVRMS